MVCTLKIRQYYKQVKEIKLNITEEYIEYYTNFRPQKKLGGMTPNLYRNSHNII